MKSFSLYEEIMLLALRNDEGTFSTGFVEYAVAGAILAELLLDKRIFIADSKRNLVDHYELTPTGDPIIDECQKLITKSSRRARLNNWVSRLSKIPRLKQKVAQQLCNHGIIKADEEKVLFLFSRTIYPEINPAPEKAIVKRLSDAIFSEEKEVAPRTVVLISLARAAGLLEQNLGEKEIRSRKKRIDKIVAGEVTGAATRDVIGVLDSARAVASLLPALLLGTANS